MSDVITPPVSPLKEDQNHEGLSADDLTYKRVFKFRWFSCLGEAKLEKIILHEESFLENYELDLFEDFDYFPYRCKEHKDISLFNVTFDLGTALLYNLEVLFRLARGEILAIEDAAKSSHADFHMLSDFTSSQDCVIYRKNCVTFFLHIREYLSWCTLSRYTWVLHSLIPKLEENLSKFRLFLRRITFLPEYILHHAANSQGNKCLQASYQLFHCHLDMLWLHLTTLYQVDRCRRHLEESAGEEAMSQQSENHLASDSLSLEQSVLALVADLLQLAVIQFDKVDVRSLLIKSPFSCSCVAELWILLQILIDKLHSKGVCDSFWAHVNKVLEGLLVPRDQSKPNCVHLVQSVTRPCANPHAFSLWFIKHTAMLSTYKNKISSSNYTMLETIVKGLLSSNVSEAHMRIYLMFIEKILIKYWEPKSEIIILLWEHFQKRLNSTFYVVGSSIDSMAIMSDSVAGMVNQVKSRLSSTTHGDDSFQMFLRILGLHLQRVNGQSQHWNQIRGRIYSKLSASKVQTLTEMGLYHLSSLFLTLAISGDLQEVAKKLQTLLSSLPEDAEENLQRLVWRSHLALCQLFSERGLDFTAVLSPLTAKLALANSNSSQLDSILIRTFLEGVKDILECSPNLKIDHNILIGSWISKYLEHCSPNDASRLLEVLQGLIQRVLQQPLEQIKFQNELWQCLGPYLRLRTCEDSPPLQLADISFNLCLLSHSYSPTLSEVLHLFLNNNSTNIGLVRRFLWHLVQQKELLVLLKTASPGSVEAHEVLIVKGWLRCSLLTLEYKSSELCRITNHIAQMQFIWGICMDLPTAIDPLVHFIVAVSNKFKGAVDISERSSLRQRLCRYLTGLDKWVEPHVRQPKSPEILARIYHIVGLIFSLMPSFIYIKSRPNTVLKGVLDVMFLPLSAYKPDFEPNPHTKAAITADIHLYITGLADLGKMQDAFIERCIEDLVKVYLPWVVVSPRCRLAECVGRGDGSSRLILSTACLAFLKRKASSPHPHATQALRFFSSIATHNSRETPIMLLLVDCCLEHICDVIMYCDDHHPCKTVARDLLVQVFECHSFGDELSEKIMQKFGNLCRDYLPFMPGKLFSLFHLVLQHRPELVSRFLPTLQNHIKIVESKRGISYDHSLRGYVDKLEVQLNCLRNGR